MTSAVERPAPTLRLRDVRAAVPETLRRPSTGRSLAHLAVDLGALAAVTAAAVHWSSPWLWPFWWLAQGTLFWALFVIGHDCGHGAFSRSRRLEEWVGHLTHSPLLVPYHAWRLSHLAHHRHAGHADRDETWFPLTDRELAGLPTASRWLRLHGFLLAFPFYLVRGTTRRASDHFRASAWRTAADRRRVRRSVAACAGFALLLLGATLWIGPGPVLRHWLAPWLVFVVWIDLVTFLHHTDPDVPWYRGRAWSPLDGALATVDRSYGLFEPIHHNAGSHVVHHLVPDVPHYHLRAATEAIRPVLGDRYRRARTPIHRALWRAARGCRWVPAEGDVVRYRAGPVASEPPARRGSGAGSRPATT